MSELELDMEAVAGLWLTGDSSDDEFIEHLEQLGCSHFEALEHFEDYGGDFKEATKRTIEMLSLRISKLTQERDCGEIDRNDYFLRMQKIRGLCSDIESQTVI